MVGVVSSGVLGAIRDTVDGAGVPLIVANAGNAAVVSDAMAERLAGTRAVDHQLLAADLAAQGLVGDFIGRGGDVPGVLGMHGGQVAGWGGRLGAPRVEWTGWKWLRDYEFGIRVVYINIGFTRINGSFRALRQRFGGPAGIHCIHGGCRFPFQFHFRLPAR